MGWTARVTAKQIQQHMLYLIIQFVCTVAAVWVPSGMTCMQRIRHRTTPETYMGCIFGQVGSEDIDSGEVSQSEDGAEGQDGDSARPSGRHSADSQAASESDDGEDEVGDLSWEAVMAAVQGGGSDDEAEEEQEAGFSADVADETLELPSQQVSEQKPSRVIKMQGRKQPAASSQRGRSHLGKRPRQK